MTELIERINDNTLNDDDKEKLTLLVKSTIPYNKREEAKEKNKIRYREDYAPGGTNVNFIEALDKDEIFVRTYERGVENETLSCGTGVTAAAIAFEQEKSDAEVKIKTLGGNLSVRFHRNEDGSLDNVWLIGPAKQVFSGKMELSN